MPKIAPRKANAAPKKNSSTASGSILSEFLVQQLPMIAIVLALGFAAAYLEYGYIPNGDRPFPLAGVRVTVWHLISMGLWTGYTMALVGQAAGLFALPYSTSVLQFDNPHVSPTMLVLTFISPVGALLGFRRSGQWNLDFALAVCLGGVIGGLVGPFFRATVLANADVFRLTLGIALGLFGLQLCWKAIHDYSRFGKQLGADFVQAEGRGGKSSKFRIVTTKLDFFVTGIRFGAHERNISNIQLFLIGAVVGAFSGALGVGGGFLLVPIFAMMYRLPLYVMVAATIPYTIVLSTAGIVSFTFILPLMGTPAIAPEWSWGLFTAAGGLLGSWLASKTQLYIPEHLLNWFLGGLTALIGTLYCLSFAGMLPFRI
jgi:uncharacterized membrane protein YfcA